MSSLFAGQTTSLALSVLLYYLCERQPCTPKNLPRLYLRSLYLLALSLPCVFLTFTISTILASWRIEWSLPFLVIPGLILVSRFIPKMGFRGHTEGMAGLAQQLVVACYPCFFPNGQGILKIFLLYASSILLYTVFLSVLSFIRQHQEQHGRPKYLPRLGIDIATAGLLLLLFSPILSFLLF